MENNNDLSKYMKPIKQHGGKGLAYFLAGVGIVAVAGAGVYFSGILNKVKVTYVFNGQEYEVSHFSKVSMDEIATPEAPNGYRFDGWYKDANYTVKVATGEVFKSDATIYPLFTPRTYTVAYLSNDGQGTFVVDGVQYNSVFQVQDKNFVRENYEFLGYSYDSDLNYATDNDKIIRVGDNLTLTNEGLDLYAVWRGRQITVDVNMSNVLVGGEPMGNLSWPTRYGEKYTLPNLVDVTHSTDSSKVFGGYLVNGVVHNVADTIVATTDDNSVDVSINWLTHPTLYMSITNPETGEITQIEYEGNNADSVHTYNLATALDTNGRTLVQELELMGISNYTAVSILNGQTRIAIDANYSTGRYVNVLSVEFEGAARTIELYNGETLFETLNVKYGDIISLPRLLDDNKQYLGYSTESYTGIHPQYVGKIAVKFDNDTTRLRVDWRVPKLYINANGGVGSADIYEIPANRTYTFTASQIALLRSQLTRKYYTLSGFSTDPSATTGSFSVTAGDDDVTIILFAVWERNVATITFADTEEGSTLPDAVQIYEGSYYTLNTNGFSKVGHYLTGFTYNGETYAIGDQVFIEENSIITPIWCQYQISFIGAGDITSVTLADGTVRAVQDLEGGERIVAPNCARPEGGGAHQQFDTKLVGANWLYFAGWSKNENATVPTYFMNETIINYDEELILYAVYMPATAGLTYSSNGDDTYYINMVTNRSVETTNGILVLPNTYKVGNTYYPVTSIVGSFSEYSSSNFEHIVIGNGIETIDSMAFALCANVTNLTLPDSVTSVSVQAFEGCAELNKIIVSDNNANYSSQSGVLYNKAKTEIIKCPVGIASVELPSTLTSIGINAFKGCTSLTSVVLPNGVTTINEEAFLDCTSLTSVTLPNGLTTIDRAAFGNCIMLNGVSLPNTLEILFEDAFADCISLTSIEIPAGVEIIDINAFEGCTNLTSVTLNEGLLEIYDSAFLGCGLTSVNIPASVTSISATAFEQCMNLTSINVDDNNTEYSSQSGVLYNKAKTELIECPAGIVSIVIPGTVQIITNLAFRGCSKLASVTMQQGLTTIGDYAFAGCTSINSLIIPSSVTTIGGSAFKGCSGLLVLMFQEGLTQIDAHAFENCTGLTSVSIPNSVTLIGMHTPRTLPQPVFSGCTNLTNVSIPTSCFGKFNKIFQGLTGLNVTINSGVTEITEGAFDGCAGIASVTIPNSVTSIGDVAFGACTALPTITLPSGLTTLGAEVFYGCTSLTGIEIPDSVTSIGEDAFLGCTSLASVTLPSGLTTLSNGVFENCISLNNVTIPNNLTTIGASAFEGCISLSNLQLGFNVRTFDERAFYGCTSLGSISIHTCPQTTIGASAFEGCTGLHILSFDTASIDDFTINIGERAFYGCTGLYSIQFPHHVRTVGASAFQNCTSLHNVTFNYLDTEQYTRCVTSIGERAFAGCTGLTNITIPGFKDKFEEGTNNRIYYYYGIEYIAEGLFQGCTSLTNFTIPDSVRGDIFEDAFSGCTALTSVTMPNNYYGWTRARAFQNCTHLTSIVTSPYIGEDTFNGCTMLASVTILNRTNPIGARAFQNCTNLTNIVIPSAISYIGADAFKGCTGLTNVTVPAIDNFNEVFPSLTSLNVTIASGVTALEDNQFENCLGIASLTIPSSVTSFGTDVFKRCQNLVNVYISSNTFGHFGTMFNNSRLSKDGDREARLVVTVADGITTISNGAFYECETIKQVVLPSSVVTIDDYAFFSCVNIKTINLPSGLTTIGESAFDNCTSFEGNKSVTGNPAYSYTLEIPASVTSLGRSVFAVSGIFVAAFASGTTINYISGECFMSCTNLYRVTIPTSVTTIGDYAFDGCASLPYIIIPTSVTIVYSDAFDSTTTVYAEATSQPAGWDANMGGDVYWYRENHITGRNYWHYVNGVPTKWE